MIQSPGKCCLKQGQNLICKQWVTFKAYGCTLVIPKISSRNFLEIYFISLNILRYPSPRTDVSMNVHRYPLISCQNQLYVPQAKKTRCPTSDFKTVQAEFKTSTFTATLRPQEGKIALGLARFRAKYDSVARNLYLILKGCHSLARKVPGPWECKSARLAMHVARRVV